MTGPSTLFGKPFLRSAVLVGVVGFFAALSFSQKAVDTEQKLEDLSSQAQLAQQRGDYASAAQAYKALAELRPDVPEIWANLGLMHQFLGNYSQADRDFQTALQKNPRLYMPHLFLGLNRLRVHQVRAALTYLKDATSLNNQDEQAALGLARAYSEIRDDIGASQWFEHALQINPQDSDAWYGLGISYLNLQDAAVVELKKLDQNNVYARALVADAFLEQGRSKDAIPIYKELETQNRPPCLNSQLGLAYAQSGAVEIAGETLQRETAKHPGCLSARIGLAQIALTHDDIAEMLRQLHWVEDREPHFLRTNVDRLWKGLNAETLKNAAEKLQSQPWAHDPMSTVVLQSADLGVAARLALQDTDSNTTSPANRGSPTASPRELWEQGSYDACAAKLRETKAQTPALTSLLEQCSFYAAEYQLTLQTSRHVLRVRAHDFEALYWEAKSAEQLSAHAFTKMNAIAPNSPKVHFLMAQLHREREEYSAAEAEYSQVLRARASADEQTTAHLGLAHVYFRDSQDDRALEQLQGVLTADSSNADAHGLMGELLVRRHQFEDAVPHLELALQGASPDSLPELHSLLAKCYAAKGDYPEAVKELGPALPADTMGAFHYQLYQLYQKMGDQKSAQAALLKSEQLREQKSRSEQDHMLPTTP